MNHLKTKKLFISIIVSVLYDRSQCLCAVRYLKFSTFFQRMEEAYKYAYCLYCQVHTTDLKNMKEHEATGKHNTVKYLHLFS